MSRPRDPWVFGCCCCCCCWYCCAVVVVGAVDVADFVVDAEERTGVETKDCTIFDDNGIFDDDDDDTDDDNNDTDDDDDRQVFLLFEEKEVDNF